MPDVFNKSKRSEIMSRILGRGNKTTEVALANILRKKHITGWRKHAALFGQPDFVFRKHRLAVFVDGCFWHSCPRHASQPTSNVTFWKKKLTANRNRDLLVNAALRKQGWRVLRIWQHDL